MTVGRVKDFNFPHSGPTHVKGYFRGGGVKPPASGMRAPKPASGLKAMKSVEGAALRPSRGPRVGAKLAVAKPASMKMGALQNASTPLITPPDVSPPAMARGGRLNAAARKALPKSAFGMPESRKYPMPDASHAANAKARASQAVNAGRMSKAQAMKIDLKADRVLGEKD